MEPESDPERTAWRACVVMGNLTDGNQFSNGYFPVPRSLLRDAADEPTPDAPGEDPDNVMPTAVVSREDASR